MAKRKGNRRRRVSQNHGKNIPLQRAIKQLAKMNGRKRQSALRQANNVFIRQMSNAVKGVRRKHLSTKIQAKLSRHRAALRSLANPQMSLQSKRRVLVRQKGGFFGAVLASLAAPLIGSVVKALTQR